MKRVLLAGLFHETHTFLGTTTALESFATRVGGELLLCRGDGSPLSGVLQVADESGWDVTPIIDMRATPSGTVADAVLDHFLNELESVAAPRLAAGSVDGVYLVLHGAMVTESFPDVEGEVIDRLRALPGAASVPICGVLDLHGNISQRTMTRTQGMVAYRCNPHTDACDSAIRGARILDRILTDGTQSTSVWAQPPIIWPPTGTGTADDPMNTLTALAREIEDAHPDIVAVNVFGGFGFADTPEAGVSFSAVTFGSADEAARQIDSLMQWSIDQWELGNRLDTNLEDVLPDVRADVEAGRTPVIIVEPADNIGGGAPGDTTGLLRCLLDRPIGESVVVINDPAAVEGLTSFDVGERRPLSIGGKLSSAFCEPVAAEVELLSKSDGQFDLEDRNSHLASMNGVHINMGPCAVVRIGSTRVLLTSRKTPPFDLGQLRSQGIEPTECDVIGVKAAVAHRRAYDQITGTTYTVGTPGPCSSDLKSFPWQKVRRPVSPLDD